MFPVGPLGVYLVGIVALGMALGLVAGAVFALALGLRVQGLLTDALLGSLGLITGFVVVHYVKTLEPAFLLALIFPLMRQFARLRL